MAIQIRDLSVGPDLLEFTKKAQESTAQTVRTAIPEPQAEIESWWKATAQPLPVVPMVLPPPPPKKDNTLLIVAGVAGAGALGLILYFMLRSKPRPAVAGLGRARRPRRKRRQVGCVGCLGMAPYDLVQRARDDYAWYTTLVQESEKAMKSEPRGTALHERARESWRRWLREQSLARKSLERAEAEAKRTYRYTAR